jgi:hypothetical protein
MNGAKLCSEFARPPNKKRFCGAESAYQAFVNCIKGREEGIQQLITTFPAMYPYLSLIAKKYALNPLDHAVVEAYWIGNELLDSFTSEDYHELLTELGKRGLTKQSVDSLKEKIPKQFIPHHSFHVLYVGVGKVVGIPTTIESIRDCIVSWGEVYKVENEKLLIKGVVLQENNGKFELHNQDREIDYSADLIKPKLRDIVAIHWNECVHILDKSEQSRLENYTKQVIELVNYSR